MESLDVKEGFEETPNFRAEKIQKYKFPTYVPPNVKDDMVSVNNHNFYFFETIFHDNNLNKKKKLDMFCERSVTSKVEES